MLRAIKAVERGGDVEEVENWNAYVESYPLAIWRRFCWKKMWPNVGQCDVQDNPMKVDTQTKTFASRQSRTVAAFHYNTRKLAAQQVFVNNGCRIAFSLRVNAFCPAGVPDLFSLFICSLVSDLVFSLWRMSNILKGYY